MNRNRYKKNKPCSRIANVIALHYVELRKSLRSDNKGNFLSCSYEDIFEDTVICVIHDPDAVNLHSDSEIIEHFKFRYRMIEYQTIKDSYLIKEIPYADYLQTKTPTDEE